MNKQEVAAEIERISKLLGVSKDRYQRHGFNLVKVDSNKKYNEFKVDMVDKNNRRHKL